MVDRTPSGRRAVGRPQRVVAFCLLLVAACTPDPQSGRESSAFPPASDVAVSSSLFARVEPILRPSTDPLLVVPVERVRGLSFLRTALFFGQGIAVIPLLGRAVQVVASDGTTVFRHEGYVSPLGLGRHGDDLLTWDSWTQRLVRLDAGGAVVDERDWKAELTDLLAGPGTPLGGYGDEIAVSFRAYSVRDAPPIPGLVRYPANVAFLDPGEGILLRSIELPGEERWTARIGNASDAIPVIFGRSVEAAVAHGGAWIADTDSLVFRLHTGVGVIREVSFDHVPVPVHPDWVQAVWDSLQGVVDDPERRSGGESDVYRVLFEAGVPARSTLPAFSRLLGGADGRLWIREFPIPGAESILWVGLDEELRPEVRMELPLELEVLDIDDGRLLVGRPGFDGVEILTLEGRP